MKTLLSVLGGLVVTIVIFVLVSIHYRNQLIDLDEAVKMKWRDIGVQLERRADLVPNLVSTVKGYASHEKEVFTAVAEARGRLLSAQTPGEKAVADVALKSAIGRLLAISEQYPQLKSDTLFVRLQDELAGTENRIAVARLRYNEIVKTYNAAIRKFPGVFFAAQLALERCDYYEVPEGKTVTDVPKVSF
jgi:LemA protein